MRDNHLSENLAVSVSSLTDRGDNEKVLHDDISTHPRPQRYADIFPRHAFEQPRDPDEVTPATTHEHSRANAAEPTPRPPDAGPTQVHGVQLALQQPASYLARTFTRIPQNVLRINSAWPSPQTDPPSTPAFITQQDPDEATRNRDRQTHRTQPVPPSDPVATQLGRHIDNTQHPLVRTRRQQQHIRTSQNQDRHAHTEPPRTTRERSQGQARTTLQKRVQDWIARIDYEPLPRLGLQPAPSTRDPIADEHAEHVLCDYGYKYRDARRED
ncbi:hypothetical protein EDB85DRAFT_1901388 [Lactarius pseudohatsudake]|nr:hypothetical protein EDB85DRAFT_1901388 [Lactarius pseudohatsudake]